MQIQTEKWLEKRKEKNKRKGRWIKNNITFKKEDSYRKRENGYIQPVVKRCQCGRRVRNHHFYCDICWKKRQETLINKK